MDCHERIAAVKIHRRLARSYREPTRGKNQFPSVNISLRYRLATRRTGWKLPVACTAFAPLRRVSRTCRVIRGTARRRTRPIREPRDPVIAYLHRGTRVSSPRTASGGSDRRRFATSDSGAQTARPGSRGITLARISAISRPGARSSTRGTTPRGLPQSGTVSGKSCRPPPAIWNNERTSASSSAFRLLPWRPWRRDTRAYPSPSSRSPRSILHDGPRRLAMTPDRERNGGIRAGGY